MDDLQISSFLAVAHTQSFSRAAALLYRSQPMVSRQIKSLEDELGAVLINRSSRPISLTEAGKTLESGLMKLRSDFSDLSERVKSSASGVQGEIKICVHAGHRYTRTLLPLLDEFRLRCPRIRVRLFSAHSGEVKSMLHNQQTDFIYARRSDYENYENFSCITVARLKSGILVPADHPCAGRDPASLSLADFSGDSFIVLPDSIAPGQERRVERECWAAGFEPDILAAPNNDTALLWLEAGRGISIVLQEHILAESPDFRFIPMESLQGAEGAVIYNTKSCSHSAGIFRGFVCAYSQNLPE